MIEISSSMCPFMIASKIPDFETIIHPAGFQTDIQDKFLNQALIISEVKDMQIFHLNNIAKTKKLSANGQALIQKFTSEGEYFDRADISKKMTTQFLQDLAEMYRELTHQDFDNIHSNITYLIFGDNNVSMDNDLEGMASSRTPTASEQHLCKTNGICPPIYWGNIAYALNPDNNQNGLHTILHELGHSFGLFHIFLPSSHFTLEQGYTDNLMDYDFFDKESPRNKGLKDGKLPNIPHKNKQFALFKWQWEIIRQDLNVIN